ncbi:uncharacterized protein VTP21DRAFT_1088 [Calcarisporiella thermophila]|uniref:uncharacterized protein n=1 Tax=Calcarisporiella thermophila TaxID=911321 RepID=UPI0037444CAD
MSQSISHASTVQDQRATQSRADLWMSADKLIQPPEEVSIYPRRKVRFAFNTNEVILENSGSSKEQPEAIPLEQMESLACIPKQYACVFEEEDMAEPRVGSNGDVWMFGRRFCGAKGVHYILPNDEGEVDRLILQHYMFRCGPGTWTMEMATEFPGSHFYGIDINKGFPEHIKPENCHFQVGNILEPLPFEDEGFDFVFVRCVGLGVYQSEWPRVIEEIVRVLRPGGYFEVVEADYNLYGSGRAFRKLVERLHNTLRARDIDPSWAYEVRSYFDEIGLEDIKRVTLSLPIGHTIGQIAGPGREWFMRLLDSLRPHLVQVMYISVNEYYELAREIEQELKAKATQFNFVSTYGLKQMRI